MESKKIDAKKVAVALSGGVDSGVAAAILVRQGYQVAGFHLHFWAEGNLKGANKCCSTESLEAARKTAALLKIPFYTLNFEDLFKKKVVDYFLKEFSSGKTPNPCVMCNREIKFGKLLEYILGLGYDFLATGHYARVRCAGSTLSPASKDRGWSLRNVGNYGSKSSFDFENQVASPCVETPGIESRSRALYPKPYTLNPCYHLLSGLDSKKDQSYFLYNLTQEQLAHILFPIGDYVKSEVREMAKKWKLPVAERPESQEICFFPETDYRPFLKRHIGSKIKPGQVVDTKGQIIGEHDGLPLYTLGQRHGFRVNSKFTADGSKPILPLYVVGMDAKKNQLIVGWGKEAEKKEFSVEKINWVNSKKTIGLECLIRIRHQGSLYPGKLRKISQDSSQVILDEAVRSVTPGQSAVFYQDLEVLGGGVII